MITLLTLAAVASVQWAAGPALPHPVANNAIAAIVSESGASVYSMLGIDSTKEWSGIVNWAFRWNVGGDAWEVLPPVPGPGRLAATAEANRGRVYLFGGYTVAADGSEKSVANVDVFDPRTEQWSSAAPFPLPVDDAISGVWRDSLIYLVSGWHDTDNVPDVQIYDPAADSWSTATSIPGTRVFGHAGAIAQNTIVYLGGANTRGEQPRFLIENSAWRGDIDPDNPTSIEWTQLPPPPWAPLYRAAAVAIGRFVVFAGGTDNPYNYNGMGYDGNPAEPKKAVFAYDVERGEWVEFQGLKTATMDHRAIAFTGNHLVIVGGMESDQRVTTLMQMMDIAQLRPKN